MDRANIRVSERTYATLQKIADESGESLQEVLTKAVEMYRKDRFWTRVNAAYAAL